MKRDPELVELDEQLTKKYRLICVGTDGEPHQKQYAVEFEIQPDLPRKWGLSCEMNAGSWTVEMWQNTDRPDNGGAHVHFPVLKKGDVANLKKKILGLLKLTEVIK